MFVSLNNLYSQVQCCLSQCCVPNYFFVGKQWIQISSSSGWIIYFLDHKAVTA